MSVEIEIAGVKKQFESQAAADEAAANHANVEAAKIMLAAGTGGSKYRDEAFGLALIRHCVNADLTQRKLKPKDITFSAIYESVGEVSDEQFEAAVEHARKLRAAFATLTGKHQAMMKGGIKPVRLAEAFAVIVKPETGAAQKATAMDLLTQAV